MRILSKRSLSILLSIVLFFSTAFAAVGDAAVANFLNQKGIVPGSVAVKIIDLKDGSVVASHNASTPLIPASIMKSVTSAALLNTAGPDYRYHTKVYIDGPVELGYLRGNLIIEGSCDPTINSEKNPITPDIIEEIVEVLRQKHINRIEGSIIIDESGFRGEPRHSTWSAADCNKYYGAGSHAFNFNDNRRGDSSVKNPSTIFLTQIKKSFNSNGIDLEDKAIHEGKRFLLFDHVSAPLDDIMRSCMMRSDNMFAESMLRTYGKLEGGDGSTDDSTAIETQYWEEMNLPLEGVAIVDGSGLSRSNRVTANFMVEMLKSMSGDATYASLFPLAGQEGTLRKFLAGSALDSYIAMKTGSMTGVQCYAGYKLDDEYVPTHVVVIILNDIPADRDPIKKATERMLLTIFNAN